MRHALPLSPASAQSPGAASHTPPTIRPFGWRAGLLCALTCLSPQTGAAQPVDAVYVSAYPILKASGRDDNYYNNTVETKTGQVYASFGIRLSETTAMVNVLGVTQTVSDRLGSKEFDIPVPLNGKTKCTSFSTKTAYYTNTEYTIKRKVCLSITKLSDRDYQVTHSFTEKESEPDTRYTNSSPIKGTDYDRQTTLNFTLTLNPDYTCKISRAGGSSVTLAKESGKADWKQTRTATALDKSYCTWN